VKTVAPETVALADAARLALAVDVRSSTRSRSRRAGSGGSVARHDGTIVAGCATITGGMTADLEVAGWVRFPT